MDRFSRDVDIIEPSVVTTNRFDHIEKEASSVEKAIMLTPLEAWSKEDQVHLKLGSLETWGPTFNLGVIFLGEALLEDSQVETSDKPMVIEGPLEQALSAGSRLLVEKLGPDLLACLSRNLPSRVFEDRGTTYTVFRRGSKKAKGTSLAEAIQNALEAEEVVTEGSLFR